MKMKMKWNSCGSSSLTKITLFKSKIAKLCYIWCRERELVKNIEMLKGW